MKVKCRRCDICMEEMDNWDVQFWIRQRVLWGAPAIGMKRMDICNGCFAKMQVYIRHPELIEPKEDV